MKVLPKVRRAEGKTNYLKRKRMLEGAKPRVVIRKTNRYVVLQYVESKAAQDKVKFGITTKELLEHGWPKNKAGSLKSLPACYLAGIILGEKIKNEKSEAIVDIGLIRSTKGSRLYAAVKGIIDAGAKVKHNKNVFPEESRIKNKNVMEFFDKIKEKLIKEKAKHE